jgi:polyisoprenoid-binding protein YceI
LAIDHIGGGDDPWGGHRQGFTGTTTIAMKDFGIPTNLGPAAQNVELTMVVEGIRQ